MDISEEFAEHIIDLLDSAETPEILYQYSELQNAKNAINEMRITINVVKGLLQKELVDSRIENTLPTETQALIEHIGGDE